MKKCSDFKDKTLKQCPPNICKINSNRCILKNKMMNELQEDRLISSYINIRDGFKQKIQLESNTDSSANTLFDLDDILVVPSNPIQELDTHTQEKDDLLPEEKSLYEIISKYNTIENFCIFGNNYELLKNHFNNYTIPNMSIQEKTHTCIGSGRNGFQLKVNLSKDTISNQILLKSSKDGNMDNLIYEFLVGLCVNKFSNYFPIFCQTYGICKYKNKSFVNEMNTQCRRFGEIIRFKDDNNINNYLENFNTTDLEQSIINGCLHRYELCLLLQYYDSIILEDLYNHNLTEKDIPLINELISIFHFVFEALDKLKDMFTHYDLHTSNVLLYKIPNDEYVEIIYHDDTSREYHVKSRYIPIIIDFGHSFIDCNQIDSTINTSDQIFNTVCNNDTYSHNPVCEGKCGWDSGFFYNDPGNKRNYYISSRNPNRSHDLKLLDFFYNRKDLSELENIAPHTDAFILFLSNVNFVDEYGTPELNTREMDQINNVQHAAEGLRSIIQMPDFIEYNENLFIGKKKYGTLHIWVDKLKEFEFTFD
jgi:hypothetical protein